MNIFGRIGTKDIPSNTIEVPVKIVDVVDGGREYKTIWYAGFISSLIEEPQIVRPSVDWIMIDVTNSLIK